MAYTNLSYEDRLNNALLKSLWLQRDLAEFTAFNPTKFTAQYLADFKTAYETALALPTDETLTDIGTDKTETVQQKMEAARQLYQRKIKYFLEEAFAKKKGILNSFGYDDYQNARTSVARMIAFLNNLELRCTQEEAALLAVGINNSFLTDIATAKNELAAAYADQQTYFGSQKDMTQTRKATFEKMDDFVREVCKVGKILFEGVNDAKYSDYIVYKTRTNTETVTKTIAANTEVAVLTTEAEENTNLQIENIGETQLNIYVSNSLQKKAERYPIAVASSAIFLTNTLSDGNYGMLIVGNPNPTDGKIRVRVMDVVEDEGE